MDDGRRKEKRVCRCAGGRQRAGLVGVLVVGWRKKVELSWPCEGEKMQAIMGRRNSSERKLGNAQARRMKLTAAWEERTAAGWASRGKRRGRWEVVGASRSRAWAWGGELALLPSAFCPSASGVIGLALPPWLPFQRPRLNPDTCSTFPQADPGPQSHGPGFCGAWSW